MFRRNTAASDLQRAVRVLHVERVGRTRRETASSLVQISLRDYHVHHRYRMFVYSAGYNEEIKLIHQPGVDDFSGAERLRFIRLIRFSLEATEICSPDQIRETCDRSRGQSIAHFLSADLDVKPPETRLVNAVQLTANRILIEIRESIGRQY